MDREPTLHRVNWSMYIQRTENGRLGLARATRGSIFRTESRTHGARGAGKSGMHRQSTFCEMHATVAIIPQGREAGQQTEDLGPLMFPSVAALVLQTHGRSPAILYLYVLTILPVFPLTSPADAPFFPTSSGGNRQWLVGFVRLLRSHRTYSASPKRRRWIPDDDTSPGRWNMRPGVRKQGGNKHHGMLCRSYCVQRTVLFFS